MESMPMSPPAMDGNTSMNNSIGDSPMMTPMTTTNMQMSFYWGKDAVVLFSGWPKESLGLYILAFFFIFLLAFAVEFLSHTPPNKLSKSPIASASIQAVVYAFRTSLVYLVMLAVMSFNVGIFIAAVAGHTLGFFVVKVRALTVAKGTDSNEV
ncbi:copper transporter 2-like [Benincasa hispida]|uniref:copper transporter 2-like n=1 Tax=Benincasa hispida TaxID=102211 RepID=UPI0018FF2979|nr:copper transporter 2-like [Benincasa hispida]